MLFSEPETHKGVSCDTCHVSPVVGRRWKCGECDDFDLCHSCLHAGPPSCGHDVNSFVRRRLPTREEIIHHLSGFESVFRRFNESVFSLHKLLRTIADDLCPLSLAWTSRVSMIANGVEAVWRALPCTVRYIAGEPADCIRTSLDPIQELANTLGSMSQHSILRDGTTLGGLRTAYKLRTDLAKASFSLGVKVATAVDIVIDANTALYEMYAEVQAASSTHDTYACAWLPQLDMLRRRIDHFEWLCTVDLFRRWHDSSEMLRFDASWDTHLRDAVTSANELQRDVATEERAGQECTCEGNEAGMGTCVACKLSQVCEGAADFNDDATLWYFVGEAFIQGRVHDRVFMSHRGPDTKALLVNVAQREGASSACFIDIVNVSRGESATRFIFGNLARSRDAAFLLSRTFASSPYCCAELILWQAIVANRPSSIESRTFVAVERAMPPRHRQLVEQLCRHGGLHIAYECDSAFELCERAVAHVLELYPAPDAPPLGRIGLWNASTSGLREMRTWNGGYVNLYALMCVGIQVANGFARALHVLPDIPILVDPTREVPVEEIDALLQLSGPQAVEFQRVVESMEPTLSSIPARWLCVENEHIDARTARMLRDGLVQRCEAIMIAVTDLIAERLVTLLRQPAVAVAGAVWMGTRGSLALVLSFLACAAERIKDACSTLMGRSVRMNQPPEFANALPASERMLLVDDIEFDVCLAIDNLADFLRLLPETMGGDVGAVVRALGGDEWTADQWFMACLGVQEQYRLRRRCFMRSNSHDDVNVTRVLGAREVALHCVATNDHLHFVDRLLYAFAMLGIQSRTVMFLQVNDHTKVTDGAVHIGWPATSGLERGDVPHYTFKSASQLFIFSSMKDKLADILQKTRTVTGLGYAVLTEHLEKFMALRLELNLNEEPTAESFASFVREQQDK